MNRTKVTRLSVANQVRMFALTLKDKKDQACEINNTAFRYVWTEHSEGKSFAQVYVGRFCISTIYSDSIYFTLPNPMREYVRFVIQDINFGCASFTLPPLENSMRMISPLLKDVFKDDKQISVDILVGDYQLQNDTLAKIDVDINKEIQKIERIRTKLSPEHAKYFLTEEEIATTTIDCAVFKIKRKLYRTTITYCFLFSTTIDMYVIFEADFDVIEIPDESPNMSPKVGRVHENIDTLKEPEYNILTANKNRELLSKRQELFEENVTDVHVNNDVCCVLTKSNAACLAQASIIINRKKNFKYNSISSECYIQNDWNMYVLLINNLIDLYVRDTCKYQLTTFSVQESKIPFSIVYKKHSHLQYVAVVQKQEQIVWVMKNHVDSVPVLIEYKKNTSLPIDAQKLWGVDSIKTNINQLIEKKWIECGPLTEDEKMCLINAKTENTKFKIKILFCIPYTVDLRSVFSEKNVF